MNENGLPDGWADHENVELTQEERAINANEIEQTLVMFARRFPRLPRIPQHAIIAIFNTAHNNYPTNAYAAHFNGLFILRARLNELIPRPVPRPVRQLGVDLRGQDNIYFKKYLKYKTKYLNLL